MTHKGNPHFTTRQKGGSQRRRRSGMSSYAILNKGRRAAHYDRPYLDGTWKDWEREKDRRRTGYLKTTPLPGFQIVRNRDGSVEMLDYP